MIIPVWAKAAIIIFMAVLLPIIIQQIRIHILSRQVERWITQQIQDEQEMWDYWTSDESTHL